MKLTTTLLLVMLSSPIYAQPFSRADLSPFIRLHANRLSSDIFGNTRVEDIDYTVTRGGALNAIESSRFGNGEFTTLFVRGVGTPNALNSLKRTITKNQIGLLKSCEIDNGPWFTSSYELIWYGKGGRRNAFNIYYAPIGSTGLPACPSGVDAIVGAINDYFVHVVTKPDSETLGSRLSPGVR